MEDDAYDAPYDNELQSRSNEQTTTSSPSLLSLRSRSLFSDNIKSVNIGTSLGSLLNASRDAQQQLRDSQSQSSSSKASVAQARSISDDYPAYPSGGGGDYGNGLLGGSSYGAGWGSKAQRVVYIAIPLNALSALMSSNQLNSLGIGSIFPSLPPIGGGIGGGYGGGSLRQVITVHNSLGGATLYEASFQEEFIFVYQAVNEDLTLQYLVKG